jgi:tetratricopeptide (TPR) repeat protein
MASIPEALAVAHEHHQAGRLREAERIYRLILEKQPDHPDAVRLLGVVALQVARYADAVSLLQQAVTIRPDYAEACTDLGLALQGVGRLEDAHAAHAKALALKPDFAEAHNNLGLILHAQGELSDAVAAYEKALRLRPLFPLALNNLGSVLQAQGKMDEAIATHQQAISQAPTYAEAHYNLGLALQAQTRFEEAGAAYEQAILLKPRYVEAYNNLGIVRQHQGNYDAAIAAYRKALALKPEHVETHNNLGLALQAVGLVQDALRSFDRAVQLKPDYVDACVNRAHCLLLMGDLTRGFTEYEARWRRKDIIVPKFVQPVWDGSERRRATILLHAEQGFGDTIQFIRYAPLVAERVGRVLVECDPALCRLVASVSGVDGAIARGEALPDFDVHAPLLSLPRIFGTTLETIPSAVPYITRPASGFTIPSLAQNFLRIGMVWSGRPEHGNNRNRSCPLAQFLRLQDSPEVVLFSLQKGPQVKDLAQLNGELKVEDLSEKLTDLADTAFILHQLDLIITVDTSVAHLAGALGRPVWVLLSYAADWRWLREREDSPWYPTMRLFRQPKPGDWDSVFDDVEQELKNGA